MNHLSLCVVHTFVINLGDLKLFWAPHKIKQSFISTCFQLLVIETIKLSTNPSFALLHSFTLFQKDTKQIITITFIWHIIAFNSSANFVMKQRLNRSTWPLCSLIVETSLKEIIKVAMLVETIKFKLKCTSFDTKTVLLLVGDELGQGINIFKSWVQATTFVPWLGSHIFI